MRHELRLLAAALLVAAASTFAMAETFSALRGSTPLDQEGQPPVMTPEMNTSEREARNYPEQPPLIPHSTEGYEVSIRGNKCLSCHARSRIRESQAPMISVTHYQDREGNNRTSIELDVDEIGPSLRYATASTTKTQRSGGGGFGGNSGGGAPQGQGGGGGWDSPQGSNQQNSDPWATGGNSGGNPGGGQPQGSWDSAPNYDEPPF